MLLDFKYKFYKLQKTTPKRAWFFHTQFLHETFMINFVISINFDIISVAGNSKNS